MRDPGDECDCPACTGDLEPFIAALVRLLMAPVENPGVSTAREEFVLDRPFPPVDLADAGARLIPFMGM